MASTKMISSMFAPLAMLLWLTASPVDCRTCAHLYGTISQTCGGSDFTVAQSGGHVGDLMTFDNIISQVLVESGCVLTLWTEKDYGGPCISIEGYKCSEIGTDFGAPVGCDGHHPPGGTRDESHPLVALSIRHPRDVRRADETWDNAPSSYKCDCSDE